MWFRSRTALGRRRRRRRLPRGSRRRSTLTMRSRRRGARAFRASGMGLGDLGVMAMVGMRLCGRMWLLLKGNRLTAS